MSGEKLQPIQEEEMKFRSLIVAALAVLAVLATSGTAGATSYNPRPGETWVGIPTPVTEPVLLNVTPVPAQRAGFDRATRTLKVTVQYSGCDHTPRVTVIRNIRGVVTIRATVTRPTSRNLICTTQVKSTQVSVPVRGRVTKVIDQKTRKNILVGYVTTMPVR